MSNGLTSVVLAVLAMAGARRAVSAWERRLVYWLADHDQSLVGLGMVGFDVADLGWTGDDLEAQRRFVLAMIDGALAREGWDRLGYRPREESVLPVLRQLRGLIEALPGEALEPVGSWLPDELPTEGDCALHRVPLARLGCMLCNDAGLGREPDQAAWTAAFEAFLAAPGPWRHLVDWARQQRCLPLACDLTSVIGVTAGGSFREHTIEELPGTLRGTRRIVDPTLVNRAILSGRNGVAKHPWLSALLPPRPEDARVCWVCTGTGLPVPGVVCSCGGAGWVPAWDDYVKSGGG